jgi:hypothetical protein
MQLVHVKDQHGYYSLIIGKKSNLTRCIIDIFNIDNPKIMAFNAIQASGRI